MGSKPQWKQHWNFGIVACVAGVAILIVLAWFGRTRTESVRYLDGRLIPPTGLLVNANSSQPVVGDAKDDLRVIYAAMARYVKLHDKFPDDPRQLIAFTQDEPEGNRVTKESFCSPDYKFADTYSCSDDGFCYQWRYRSPRPDGKPMPARVSSQKEYVWIATDVYERNNRMAFRDGTYKDSPSGKTLVLWNNGDIEELERDDEVLVQNPLDGTFTHYIRGEADLPQSARSRPQPRTGSWANRPAGI